MSPLIEELNAISIRQGREPIDPTRIMDPGAPAALDTDRLPIPEPMDFESEYVKREEPEPPPVTTMSPLVALARQPLHEVPRPVPEPEAEQPEPLFRAPTIHSDEVALVVMGKDASYEGQAIRLSDEEEASIASIVVKAIARRVQEQHKEIMARFPKRTRKARSPQAVAVVEPPKRKRGRPKKVKP